MGDVQAELAATLRRKMTGAVKKVHRHRHGSVLRVDNTRPFCDVLLDGHETQGVAFYGTAPNIGDPVDVLIEADGYMQVEGRATGTGTTNILFPSPVIDPATRAALQGLGRMTLFGGSWLTSLLEQGEAPAPPGTDVTPPTQPLGLTASWNP